MSEFLSDMDNIPLRLRKAKVVEPSMPSENFSTVLGEQAADLYEQQAAEIERLMERNRELEKAVSDVVETWYWWRDDPIDRCRSVVEATISEAGELIPPKEQDDG